MRLEPGTVVGSYRIEGVLGRGGMGVVYSARHVELDRRVAVKVLTEELGSDPEFLARFRREGRLQASLSHPHVVTVYEAGESEYGLYLAIRLVPGPSLAALMQERTLDADRALALLRQVADALDAAHAAGLVHRDVKPQNVLVGDADDAYLGDFGLTTVGGATGVTATGKLMGTIAYLAPEVILTGEAGPASDRYAFAATVFEALTGTAVFPRRTEGAILHAHTSEPPPRISGRRDELPGALDEVFARGLAKEPSERPDTAADLMAAVTAALDDGGATTLGPPPPPGAAALEGPTVTPAGSAVAFSWRTPASRRSAGWRVAAAMAGAVAATGVYALAAGSDESTPIRIPAPLAGASILGSDLSASGHTVDCRGRPPGPSSKSCTIAQTGLPGSALVVPRNGVIRRWTVRSARGELSLAVLRPRGGGAKQIARSRNEFVGNDGLHVFPTDLAVETGDTIGIVAISGSGVGLRPGVKGAATERWVPRLRGTLPPTVKPGTGVDGELLLRADFIPGGEPRLPAQVTGAQAAAVEPGHVTARKSLRFTDGRPVAVALVALGNRFVLDQFRDGRRSARIDVPGFTPNGGRIILFDVYAEEGVPEQLGVTIEWAAEDSARIVDHFYAAFAREFDFIN